MIILGPAFTCPVTQAFPMSSWTLGCLLGCLLLAPRAFSCSTAQQAGPLLHHKVSGIQIHINPTLARPLRCPKGSGHVFQRYIKLPLDLGTHFETCQSYTGAQVVPDSSSTWAQNQEHLIVFPSGSPSHHSKIALLLWRVNGFALSTCAGL